MTERRKTEVKILATAPSKDLVLIASKLISGEIYGSDKFLSDFTCVETSGKWRITALGFPTSKDWEEGLRSIGFEHVEGSKDLEVGFTLISEWREDNVPKDTSV